jgi:uncharacterized membrane protein
MSHGVYLWVKAFHLIGVFLWGGSMIALAVPLRSMATTTASDEPASRPGQARAWRSVALIGIGCAVARSRHAATARRG